MKRLLKKLLYAIAPELTAALISARSRAHAHKVLESWGSRAITEKLVQHLGSRVQDGRFAGMELTPMTHAEQIGPYLLGVYESELDGAWDVILRGSYAQIIDVGAKFGYYAIGLARRYPNAAVVAFDTDWWARKAIKQMAAANDARNIEVKGYCTPDWLARNAHEGVFVLSDCEGYEAVLFTSDVIARLSSATLVIETHNAFAPGVTDRLRASFSDTHVVRLYYDSSRELASRGRSSRRLSTRSLAFLTEAEQQFALHEVRGTQVWLVCLPKGGPNRGLHQIPRSENETSGG